MKIQSAMEYLTTYGWVILVIAIAFAALYALGIFNQGTLIPAHCILQAEWSCIDYAMNTGGVLQLKLSQSLGSDVEITGIACYQNSSAFTKTAPISGIVLHTGEQRTFLTQCYDTNGNAYLGSTGSSYQGYITIYFTQLSDGIAETASGTIGIVPATSGALSASGYSSATAYVPITLTNSQSSSTSSSFQQMVYFDPATYSANEMANLSNIEFTTGVGGTGTVLDAWIESGASASAANTVVWVNLGGSTIAGSGGTLTIYMNFMSDNSPVTNGYTGYAPQLWCATGCFQTSYAQYDNGASVFTNYFIGDSLSGWTVSGQAGITTSAPSGSPFGTNAFYGDTGQPAGNYLYTAANGQSSNMIIEYYTYEQGLDDFYFLANSIGYGQMGRVGDGSGWYGLAPTQSWTNWGTPSDTGYWTGEWVLTSIVVVNGVATMYVSPSLGNYGSEIGQNPSTPLTVTDSGNYIGLVPDGGFGSAKYWNGAIIRAYPPNGVMPSFSFGSVA